MQKATKFNSINLSSHRITPDKENFIVEHLASGEFYEMPRPAVEALEALAKGIPPEQIELDLIHKYPDEDINMSDFLRQLDEMGFLANEDVKATANESSPTVHSRWGKLLFHRKVILVYSLFFLANILLFAFKPNLFPHPQDLFPFQSIFINMLTSMVISTILLSVHEFGHVAAARAFGVPTRLRLNHRFFLLVVETEMAAIWRLPRGKRNIPLLAGLCVDHTLLLLSLSVLAFVPLLPYIVEGILGIVVLELVMMSIYQCMFFMKTDLYFIVQNVTGSYNLLENATGWLKGKIPFIRSGEAPVIYDRERNIVRGYAFFYFIGLTAIGTVFIFYAIPQTAYALSTSYDRLVHSSSVSMAADALLFFTQITIFTGLLIYSWIKKYTKSAT